ncbi:hypothetical protein [Piscirickettsia salmonis]|uniref:hypothetical protein n=1 Tax=Piscirickettsia salmonis TaxID=1238 RepID=UPI0007D7EADA|nr:hypothetical protein A0O36_02641 [Piscirickettsiaceae bacterium NZ-RLO1]
MLSNNTLAEKHARAIEQYYYLPELWFDIEEEMQHWNVPGFFFNDYKENKIKFPAFHIKKQTKKSNFYIKLNDNIGILSAGFYLLFSPIESMQCIKYDDICIINNKKNKNIEISQFKSTNFEISNTSTPICISQPIAKCIAIEI